MSSLLPTAPIRFPALRFSQNLVRLVDSWERIAQCTKAALKRGFYDGLMIVDSEGQRFHIIEFRVARKVPRRFSLARLLRFVTGSAKLEMEVNFSAPSQISLEDLKGHIFRSFQIQEEHWLSMLDFEKFRDEIVAAKTTREVFTAFREYHV